MEEYTPQESEEDGPESENDSEIDKALIPPEAPDGVRRSNRERSTKLKKAHLLNNKLVTTTLEGFDMSDISSDDLEGGEESDEDEEVKGLKIESSNINEPVNDVPMPANHRERESAIKEDHKITLRQMGQNFSIKYGFLDLRTNPDFKDHSQAYKDNLRAWYNYYYKLHA